MPDLHRDASVALRMAGLQVDAKSLLVQAGSLGPPSIAYFYDWNIDRPTPLGKGLMSYEEFPAKARET